MTKIKHLITHKKDWSFSTTLLDPEGGICTTGGLLVAQTDNTLLIHTPESTTMLIGDALIIL